MGGYKTHLTAYCLSAITLASILTDWGYGSQTELVPPFIIGCVYCLLPDIDSKTSKIRQSFNTVSTLLALALIIGYIMTSEKTLVYAAVLTLSANLVVDNLKHRGFTHSFFAGIVFSAPTLALGYEYLTFSLVGYCSHLVVDSL